MTPEDWEKLCDGCGKCCELERSGFACPSLDCVTNRCTDYDRRLTREMCLKVTPGNVLYLHKKGMLPESCAYVRAMQNKAPHALVEQARLVPFCVSGLKFQGRFNAARKRWFKLKALPDAKAKSCEDCRFKKEADVNASLPKSLDGCPNARENLRVSKR